MHDHGDNCGHQSGHQGWRAAREAKRAAWRMRRAARRASWTQSWEQMADPKFWGLDAESMRKMGMGTGTGFGSGMGQSSEIEALKAKIADMERIIGSLSQRVIVLEKLAVDDEPRLAAEIEKLRDRKDEGK